MFKKMYLLALVVVMAFSMCACEMFEKEERVAETPTATLEPKGKTTETQEEEENTEGENALHTTNYSENEVTEKVTVVVDGKEITPTDNNGAPVETIIHDGIVYLPVKTVADATGKAYYWDGPEYTVYLGGMQGTLEYPTVRIEDMTSIDDAVSISDELKDNYGNTYQRAITNEGSFNAYTHQYLLNMKYSKFKGTLYVPEGDNTDGKCYVQIIADGKTIYTSPEMDRTSAPVEVDVTVTGYNDVQIRFSEGSYKNNNLLTLCLGDAGFYQ